MLEVFSEIEAVRGMRGLGVRTPMSVCSIFFLAFQQFSGMVYVYSSAILNIPLIPLTYILLYNNNIIYRTTVIQTTREMKKGVIRGGPTPPLTTPANP
jgi:hypothetical protein